MNIRQLRGFVDAIAAYQALSAPHEAADRVLIRAYEDFVRSAGSRTEERFFAPNVYSCREALRAVDYAIRTEMEAARELAPEMACGAAEIARATALAIVRWYGSEDAVKVAPLALTSAPS